MLKYRLKKLPRKKTIVWLTILLLFAVSMTSIVRFYAAWSSSNNASVNVSNNVTTTTVFINDLESDWNYYEGLNYTKITSKTSLPTYANTYNKNTLAAVHIIYNGTDINNNSWRGRVSSANGETQYIFEYYKYYPINSDNTVTIELIDNPFYVRPTGRGFNGWVCNNNATGITQNICTNSVLSYDDDYYTRYITVSLDNANIVNGEKMITLQLNASWAAADEETSVANLNDKSMQPIGPEAHDVYIRYEKYVVAYPYRTNYYPVDTTAQTARRNTNMNSATGATRIIYRKGNGNWTLVNNGFRCPNTTGDCTFYDVYPNGTLYIPGESSVYVFNMTNQQNSTGSLYTNITNNNYGTYVDTGNSVYMWYAKNANLGTRTEPLGIANAGAYYYKVGSLTTAQKNSGLYYNYNGLVCSGNQCSGTTDAAAGYKLIQYGDDYWNQANSVNYSSVDISSYDTYVEQYDPDNNLLPPNVGDTRQVGTTCYKDNENNATVNCEIDGTAGSTSVYNYYYLVTRDTNIITGGTINNAPTVPLTLYGGTYSAGSVSDDLTLANSTLSANIDANFNNLKIGRNMSVNNSNNRTVTGGSGANTSTKNMKVMVESGTYLDLLSKGNGAQSNVAGIFVYGSDYDRASNTNNKLLILRAASAARSGGDATSSSTTPSSAMIIKSGTFGTNAGNSGLTNSNGTQGKQTGWGTSEDDTDYYTFGIYVGSWSTSSSNTALRTVLVEGGIIHNLNGGPCVSSSINGNAIGIYVKGGTITHIVGGAGKTETYGNRIVSVTGGQVTNSVAGGSNGSVNTGGTMSGDTLVYIGGNAKIGYKDGDNIPTYGNWATNTYYGVATKGSVYGAGLGQTVNGNDGVVNNSHVIVNGGTVYGNVFGGGNFGTTGLRRNGATNTIVDLYAGKIEGSVFGAGNQAGAGYTSDTTQNQIRHTITINIGKMETINGVQTPVGTVDVDGSVYGGANQEGVVRGKVDINMYAGNIDTVTTDNNGNVTYASGVYGGGYGANTYVCGNTTLNTNTYNTDSTDNNSLLSIEEIYGGSSLGTVNRCNNNGNAFGNVAVNVNGGDIGTVYGGGKGQVVGNNVTSPTVRGNIVVNIYDGLIEEAYNGNNITGTPSGNLNINVSGGEIGNVFGGSKGVRASANTTNVMITGGTIDNVYGGGNDAYTSQKANVTIAEATGKQLLITGYTGDVIHDDDLNIDKPIYGGVYGSGKGSSAYVPQTEVNIGKGSFTVEADNSDGASVYGGGYKAGTYASGQNPSGSTLVKINANATVYNVFGGSNQSGTVNSSTVNAIGGTFSGNIYGGGNVAETLTTQVNLTGSTPTNLAYTIASNDDLENGTDDETAYKTVAYVEYGNAFGGGKSADVTNATVNLNGMTLNNIFGGSNQNGLVSSSNVNINYGNVANAFGGNNAGGSTLNTKVTVNKNANNTLTIINVFGGSNGNGAYIGARNRDTNPPPNTFGSTLVELKSGVVRGNIFGGGNLAVIYGDTKVNMYDGKVKTIYGAGNMAHVGNYNTPYKATQETPYTGEYNTNATYVESTRKSTVNIVGGEVKEHVFGSGNAAFVHGQTYVNVGKSALTAITGLTNSSIKNIKIGGTIFGGSYTVASELESYNYNSIGVVGKTNVVLDSTDYYSNGESMIELTGSIYGEGNNSTIIGNPNNANPVLSEVKVINYGTNEHPVTFASIARATIAEVLDSNIELKGARNKQFRDDKSEYSFVTIGNLYLLGTRNVNNPGGTTVYAKGGGTYLFKMYSGYKDGDTFHAETYDRTTGATNGVDNRIYMPTRKVLAVSEGKVGEANPGTVHGIAFLGMYTHDNETQRIIRGIYDPSYEPTAGHVDDDTYALFDPTNNFTYVYGRSSTDGGSPLEYIEDNETGDRKTTIDGFYSNFVDSETKEFSTGLVSVTPKTENYYKWIIGEEVLEITVDLKASKYSMESSRNASITFEDLISENTGTNGDVIFKITSVRTSDFGQSSNADPSFTAQLINKADILKIDETFDTVSGVTNANRKFAITMGTSSSGWKNNYVTNIYTDSPSYTGDTEYIYDSTNGSRDLSFWLYHSKNIDMSIIQDPEIDIGLGHVDVAMTAKNPNDGDAAPELSIVVTINVYLTDDDEHDGYGYSIAPGKKYSTFATSSPTIGTDGSFSIYHSLSLDLKKEVAGHHDEFWSAEKVYDDDNYRYLSSKDKLPTGTRITMLDMIMGEQYFYEVTGNETQNPNGTYSYMLTDFISMSNVGNNLIYYDDDMTGTDSKYYKKIGNGADAPEYAIEEFIFTFDFSSTNQANYANDYQKTSNIYLELDGINDVTGDVETIIAPVFEIGNEMNYTVIKAGSSLIETSGGFVKPDGTTTAENEVFDVYRQNPSSMLLVTELTNSTTNSSYTDTIYDDYQLGAKMTFYRINEGGQRVALSYDTLDGLVVDVNGRKYYPENSESSGVIRMNLAGRISTLDSTVKLDFSNVSDAFVVGVYDLCIESFGSYDGLYYNGITATEKCFRFNLLSSDFGLVASAPEVEITHDVETGLDSEDNDVVTYTIRSTNGLANPRLKISLQQFRSHSSNNYDSLVFDDRNICDFATKIEISSEDDTDHNPVTINCTSSSLDTYYDLGPIANGDIKNYTVKVTLKHGPNENETNPATSGWRSGTYRVLFSVYDRTTISGADRDTFIGSDYEYLIIRSLDVDEYGNGG